MMKLSLFDDVILLAILLNSLFLAMADYGQVDRNGNLLEENSWRNMILIRSEVAFTVVFTLECVVKVTALGFYGAKGSYLTDRWNWLDFVVVISGYFVLFCIEVIAYCYSYRLVALLPGVPNLSMLRTFRILRPLKVLSKNKGTNYFRAVDSFCN